MKIISACHLIVSLAQAAMPLSQQSNWGLRQIQIHEASTTSVQQKKVKIAIIDTGISSKKKHQGWNFVNNSSDITDQHGHGSHISGIIQSIAPKAELLILKYYDPHSSAQQNLHYSLLALEKAIEENVDIINYSGGGLLWSQKEFELLQLAEKKGILLIAAAGNDGTNNDHLGYYPASYPLSNILSVASHDERNQLLVSSNYGQQKVHISAPGHNIYSNLHNGGFGNMTGTSQSTAFVTGVAALLLQNQTMSATELIQQITSTAKFENEFAGRTTSSGRLHAKRAMQMKNSGITVAGYKIKSNPTANELLLTTIGY